MPQTRIIIIGAGFSGLSAASVLARSSFSRQVTLIDRKKTSCFLPLLPDCIGRGIDPRHVSFDIGHFCNKLGICFLNQEVLGVDAGRNELVLSDSRLAYEYLVIASGSETNFYGNENIRGNSFKLDDEEDAVKIRAAAADPAYENYIVSGGGYTGIEVATNIALFMGACKRSPRITIVERAPSILGPLPEWMKGYVLLNLKKMGIEIKLATAIEKIDGTTVFLSTKETLSRSCVIWAAGVKTSGFIQGLQKEKNPQGRIKVDEYLRVEENCFAAGDASFFNDKGFYLRMAVQFAIAQGECAARNIVKGISGKPLVKFRPFDFGYIIPMANNRACGKVIGVDMKGLSSLCLHYLMCIFRSYGFKNKYGVISDLLKGGGVC